MEVEEMLDIKTMEQMDFRNKTVLLRIDINSPIDKKTKRISNENRINMSLPTIRYLINHKAKVAVIAHQGDSLDYQNLVPLQEHAVRLSEKLNMDFKYIDDVAGPCACEAVKKLKPAEVVLLGNLRYLSEEISTFEDAVKLRPEDMLETYLVRNLAPLFDIYINDAFAAAHRNSPSMVAFQEILPSAAGMLMMKELSVLSKVRETPNRPAVFVLGGAKISDAFGMMKQVLEAGKADKILTCGVTGLIMLIAKGYDIGAGNMRFIKDRSLDVFIEPAKEYIAKYPDNVVCPLDLAFEKDEARAVIQVENLPLLEQTMDIGEATIESYRKIIASAGTIFVNGPAGVYENVLFEKGTRKLVEAISQADGFTVIGGGDTVAAASKYVDLENVDYVCTAGGAMVRFLSGVKMPLIEAMKKAFRKENGLV